MAYEINRKADYWPTDPEAINRLERHIEFGELTQITLTSVSGEPRYSEPQTMGKDVTCHSMQL